jgi:hypothetical protein
MYTQVYPPRHGKTWRVAGKLSQAMLFLQDTSGTTLRNIQVLVMRILSSTNTDSTDSTDSQQMLPSVQGYC